MYRVSHGLYGRRTSRPRICIFLCLHSSACVYSNRSHTIQDLKRPIRDENATINQELMRWGFESFVNLIHLCNTTNKYTCIQYVLSRTTNYEHVSTAFTIINRVALHEYHEYNKLPNWISGATERYDRCLKLSTWSQIVIFYIIKNKYNLVV